MYILKIICVGEYPLHAGFLQGLICNPEKEAICSSEASDDFQYTILHYIPEDRRCENVQSKYDVLRFLLNAVIFINPNVFRKNSLILAKRTHAVDSECLMSPTISEPGVEGRI
jgi:hypothetical protein